jgi:hypothetical protein
MEISERDRWTLIIALRESLSVRERQSYPDAHMTDSIAALLTTVKEYPVLKQKDR